MSSSNGLMPGPSQIARLCSTWHCWLVAREPARTPYAARDRYVRIISQPLTCVTRAVWTNAPTIRGTDEDLAISLTGFPTPVRLSRWNDSPVYITAIQSYRLVPDEQFATGEWKATTRGYAYTIYDKQEYAPVRALAWHWHPRIWQERRATCSRLPGWADRWAPTGQTPSASRARRIRSRREVRDRRARSNTAARRLARSDRLCVGAIRQIPYLATQRWTSARSRSTLNHYSVAASGRTSSGLTSRPLHARLAGGAGLERGTILTSCCFLSRPE